MKPVTAIFFKRTCDILVVNFRKYWRTYSKTAFHDISMLAILFWTFKFSLYPISCVTLQLSVCTDCRKLYQCDQCEQICVTTSFLKKHKKLHSEERPHKCEVCKATFKDKAYLKRHEIKHSGVKDFKCDVCDKRFSHQRKYASVAAVLNL